MKNKIEESLVYIKYFILSKYGLAAVILLFVVWMIIFDDNNLIKKWKLQSENYKLKKENAELRKNIEENEHKINALSFDKEYLEKYARQVYGMKSLDEDIFIFDE